MKYTISFQLNSPQPYVTEITTKGKISGGLSELQAIVMRQTKSLLFKVLVKNSYGKLFNKNEPIKIRFVCTIDKALINKKQIYIKEDSTFTRSTYTINSYACIQKVSFPKRTFIINSSTPAPEMKNAGKNL